MVENSGVYPFNVRKGSFAIVNEADNKASFWIKRPADPDLRTNHSIINTVVDTTLSDSAQVWSLLKFICTFTYHDYPTSNTRDQFNPVKVVNTYPRSQCGQTNSAFAELCRLAGFDVRVWNLENHIASEVFYNGSWHYLDPDRGVYFNLPNKPVADVFSIRDAYTRDTKIEIRSISNVKWSFLLNRAFYLSPFRSIQKYESGGLPKFWLGNLTTQCHYRYLQRVCANTCSTETQESIQQHINTKVMALERSHFPLNLQMTLR